MSARLEPNDLGPLASMPFGKGSVVRGDNLLKDVRRNHNVELVSIGRFDENVVVADFNIRRHIAKVTRSHLSTPPRSKKAERVESGPLTFDSIKPQSGNRTVITVPLLQTIANLRQLEVWFTTHGASSAAPRRLVPLRAATPLPTPANDDCPPREAEAA